LTPRKQDVAEKFGGRDQFADTGLQRPNQDGSFEDKGAGLRAEPGAVTANVN
jgi:hypothetical protein